MFFFSPTGNKTFSTKVLNATASALLAVAALIMSNHQADTVAVYQ